MIIYILCLISQNLLDLLEQLLLCPGVGGNVEEEECGRVPGRVAPRQQSVLRSDYNFQIFRGLKE